MNKELKPCPFGADHHVQIGMSKHTLWCADPRCPMYNISIGVADWNTRPSPWIKVTPETMPKKSGYYFLRKDNFLPFIAMFCDGFWQDREGDSVCGTHWMPIPEVPDETL